MPHSIALVGALAVAFDRCYELAELQGREKVIANSGGFKGPFIANAWQSLQFWLDRSGAVPIAESGIDYKSASRDFVVNRQFPIVMKRRASDQPYFVAWIENVELLEAR